MTDSLDRIGKIRLKIDTLMSIGSETLKTYADVGEPEEWIKEARWHADQLEEQVNKIKEAS